jgi:hypothetical protein
MNREAKQILNPLIAAVRKANRDLWNELKCELDRLGREPPYGASDPGSSFEGCMSRAVDQLPPEAKRRLIELWPSQRTNWNPQTERQILHTYATLMVAELMSRAMASVNRNGYYP